MPRNSAWVVATVVLGALASGCKQNEARAEEGDAGSSPTTTPGRLRIVEIPNDRVAYVVDGNPSVRRPIVYLHGMCADPRDDLEAWGGLAKAHGTIVALVGDVPCANRPGRTQWTTDPTALDERVEAAVRAVSAVGTKLEPGELLVIGESMGAARAELLASKFRERYTRLVLVGSPQVPSPDNLGGVKAVANLAGEKEPQEKMKAGTRALEGAGTPVRFWELPGATHGQYGPEGERIMSEAVGFVATH